MIWTIWTHAVALLCCAIKLLLLFGNIINAKAKTMLDNPIEYIAICFLLFIGDYE
jgi:hypothetical protein